MNLCDIEELHHVEVTKEDEVTRRVNLHLKDPDKEVNISFIIIIPKFLSNALRLKLKLMKKVQFGPL